MTRRHAMLAAVLVLPACAGGGYTSAEFVYVEPAPYVYVVPVDRVVVVTREVLVTDGWTVFRVERSGPGRIVWARRGPNEVVRVFATPTGNRVAVRGVREIRVKDDRVRHKGWARRGGNDVVAKIDVRLRSRARR